MPENLIGVERLVSPLQSARPASTGGRPAALRAAEYPNLGYIVLRGKVDDATFMAAAESVLGRPLPCVPRSILRTPAGVVLWQSPDEWWLVCARADVERVESSLRSALSACFSQVVQNSGGLTSLRIRGREWSTLLRHLSPYDFESLPSGECVSTVLGKASFTVIRSGTDGATLVFRRSFASYIWQLIDEAALPYGIELVDAAGLPDDALSPLMAPATLWSPPVARPEPLPA